MSSRSAYATLGAEPIPGAPKRVKRLSVNGIYNKVGYDPHPGQARFHANRSRFKVVDAGRRWGKSRAGPHEMIPKFFTKKPTLGWIVAPTYDLGEKEFRVFWEVLIEKLNIPTKKGQTYMNVRTKDFRITTAWGATVEVRSAEHPDSLVGEGLDWVIMAEAAKLKLSHWEKFVRPTLSDKRGSAIFVSTPEGFNWFYDLYGQGQSREHPDWWSIKSPTWHNTRVFSGPDDPEIVEVKRSLSEAVFMQEYGAEFTSFAGRIYSEFDEGYHVIEDYNFNPDWPNFLAFDFGFRNPFVCLNIQVDPSDNVYIWNEYYERNMTATEHARRLKSMVHWRVDQGFYDIAGPDEAQSMINVFHDRKDYDNPYLRDVMLNPAPNDWKMGVQRVKEWLKMRPTHRGEPKPKLFVVRDNCPMALKEFNTYQVKKQAAKSEENMDPKEEPRKKDDHVMDAMRYFFTGHFGLESHHGYQK